MDLLSLSLHIDQTLHTVLATYGYHWTLAIIGIIVFLESSCILTPLLPGDSLLFSAGLVAATGLLPVTHLALTVWLATVIGYSLNYFIASKIKKKIKWSPKNRQRFDTAKNYYQEKGYLGIIFARFVPIIRTFIPFILGMINLNKRTFFVLNVMGASLWVGTLVFGSYFFGSYSWTQNHFKEIIALIILLSVLPYFFLIFRHCTPTRSF